LNFEVPAYAIDSGACGSHRGRGAPLARKFIYSNGGLDQVDPKRSCRNLRCGMALKRFWIDGIDLRSPRSNEVTVFAGGGARLPFVPHK
jgi:hypothetical protein